MELLDRPKVFLLAQTQVEWDGLEDYLDELGVPEWDTDSDDECGGQVLTEVAGRACYKSFKPGLNPNVTKVREGNENYIRNIIMSRHGSVLEHSTVSFALVGVSRVFTHELVRHRAGTAFSQESLRYVRLTDLIGYFPDAFKDEMMKDLYEALSKVNALPKNENAKKEWAEHRADYLFDIFTEVFKYLEEVQKRISNTLLLDELSSDFHIKKAITSAMRRLAPIGLSTSIVFTSNHRNLRYIIEQRTSLGAEEEIRKVFWDMAKILKNKFPAIYQDMEFNDDGTIIFTASKV